jgi:hypothetical protein
MSTVLRIVCRHHGRTMATVERDRGRLDLILRISQDNAAAPLAGSFTSVPLSADVPVYPMECPRCLARYPVQAVEIREALARGEPVMKLPASDLVTEISWPLS